MAAHSHNVLTIIDVLCYSSSIHTTMHRLLPSLTTHAIQKLRSLHRHSTTPTLTAFLSFFGNTVLRNWTDSILVVDSIILETAVTPPNTSITLSQTIQSQSTHTIWLLHRFSDYPQTHNHALTHSKKIETLKAREYTKLRQCKREIYFPKETNFTEMRTMSNC